MKVGCHDWNGLIDVYWVNQAHGMDSEVVHHRVMSCLGSCETILKFDLLILYKLVLSSLSLSKWFICDALWVMYFGAITQRLQGV